MKIAVLNTSILTTFGSYTYSQISVDDARSLASENEIVSAVGHQATADILTSILGVSVPMNRIQYRQDVGDRALVFKLRGRPLEGKILTRAEIDEVGYDFGLLVRVT